jgi:hypothetical protein
LICRASNDEKIILERTRGCNLPKVMVAVGIDGWNSLDLTKNMNYRKMKKKDLKFSLKHGEKIMGPFYNKIL